MLHRIRYAMVSGTFEKLSGTIESDETFVGGQAKFMHASRRARITGGSGRVDNKTAVHGVVQRGGEVRATVVDDTTSLELQGNVRRWVEQASAVYTDENRAYWGLDQFFAHKSVNHSETYVVGDVHTNSVENFWSLLKRALKGTQTHVDPCHLERYVTERAFAYNYRESSDLERMQNAVTGVRNRRLTYARLTGKTAY